MNKEQINLFGYNLKPFKINKKIALIELFGGYGSQALALKYLNIPFKHHKLCEWAVKSIQAYKDIHFENDDTDYSKELTTEEIKQYLYGKGISNNYNEPMSKEQVWRLNEESARKIYNNIQATHNLVNIQQVKGSDLEINDKYNYTYLLTYSFPCQDLSLAGKGAGMKDTSTRSGMLWEVERILKECKELDQLPDCLLMENVPQVHGKKNLSDWQKWLNSLEELGYKNYWQDLIATDYGIPQTRNRCFMISILGDYNYTFPKPMPLKLKLKDMLEDEVDEKYYLSDKMIQYISADNDKWTGNNGEALINKTLASTLNTNEGSRRCDASNYISDDVDENYNLKIKNATQKGYLEATDGDGIDISSRMEYHRGTVQKQKSQTLTTSGENDRGVVIGTYQYAKSDNFMKGKDRLQLGKEVSDTLQTTQKEGIVNSDLRIRKLTPKECFRLMGVKDEDFERVAKNQSNGSLYHLAGDSIVVDVIEAIINNLLDIKEEV